MPRRTMAWSSTTMVFTLMATGYRRSLTRVGPFLFLLHRRGGNGRRRRKTRRDRKHDGGTAPRRTVDFGPAAETARPLHEAAHAEAGGCGKGARIKAGPVIRNFERNLFGCRK